MILSWTVIGYIFHMWRTLYANLIGRTAFFTGENIAHIEFYLQGLLPKILAIYTIKYKSTQHNTTQHNTTQDKTRQDKTMQCNAMQFNSIQFNSIQYNTIQYNTIQYNTIQYNTIQ